MKITIVRAFQTSFALLALVFTWGGYVNNEDGQLGSLSATYSIVATYSAFLWGLYHVLRPKTFKFTAPDSSAALQNLIDCVLVLCLLLAGILHWATPAVSSCLTRNEEYESLVGIQIFRCRNLQAAVVFTFVTSALAAVPFVLNFMSDSGKANDSEALANGFTPVMTPGASGDEAYAAAGSGLIMVRVGRGCRFAQLILSVIIFISVVAGYKHHFTGRFMTPTSVFMLLVSWSCILYALFHVMIVDILRRAHRPSVGVERFLDLLLAVLLVLFAALYAESYQVSECATINAKFMDDSALGGSSVFRCSSLTRAYILANVNAFFFLVTLAAVRRGQPQFVIVGVGQQV